MEYESSYNQQHQENGLKAERYFDMVSLLLPFCILDFWNVLKVVLDLKRRGNFICCFYRILADKRELEIVSFKNPSSTFHEYPAR